MERNTVFISYPSEDATIADRIAAAITGMPNNKLDVFLDRVYIKGGERIPVALQEALRRTVYFVAVGTNVTRRNFDWCGQELGFYQGCHNDEQGGRATCLFHLSFPELFAGLKNFKAQSLRREHRDQFGEPLIKPRGCEFYGFLKEVAELNAKLHSPADQAAYWAEIPGWAEDHALYITDSLFVALQNRVEETWFPQGRLEITVEKGDFYKDPAPEIPLDAEVLLAGSIYNLFSLAIPAVIRKQSWSDFVQFLIDNTGSDALARIISDIVISALPAKADAKNDYVFQAPNQKFYRILLVKHSVYGDKRRELVLNFVETLEKVRGGDSKTTTLMAGLLLGSKYRSLFIEKGAKYDRKALGELGDEELMPKVSQIMHDLDRITADAASDGLADYTALQSLLGDTEEVQRLFQRWWDVFPAFERAAQEYVKEQNAETRTAFFTAYDTFLDVSRKNNARFLTLCLDAYRASLAA